MPMKKFINAPENLTPELMEGFALAYPHKIKLQGKIVLRAKPKDPSKVALVTLGGAGHEPALSGFVGEGMLDISVVGDIFAAPAAPKVFEALKKTNRAAGVPLARTPFFSRPPKPGRLKSALISCQDMVRVVSCGLQFTTWPG